MCWEDLGTIIASSRRRQILELLAIRAMTPKEISQQLNIHLSQVTRNLRFLEKRDLVLCLAPELRKGRLYGITEKGKSVMDKLKEVGANNSQGRD